MRPKRVQRFRASIGALVLGAALLLSMGGCPIDGELVMTETVRALLQTSVTSLVDSLSKYLATT